MGHYDNCRPGYCAKCGAAPGNMYQGLCEFCDGPKLRSKKKHDENDAKPRLSQPAADVTGKTWFARNGTHYLTNADGVVLYKLTPERDETVKYDGKLYYSVDKAKIAVERHF